MDRKKKEKKGREKAAFARPQLGELREKEEIRCRCRRRVVHLGRKNIRTTSNSSSCTAMMMILAAGNYIFFAITHGMSTTYLRVCTYGFPRVNGTLSTKKVPLCVFSAYPLLPTRIFFVKHLYRITWLVFV